MSHPPNPASHSSPSSPTPLTQLSHLPPSQLQKHAPSPQYIDEMFNQFIKVSTICDKKKIPVPIEDCRNIIELMLQGLCLIDDRPLQQKAVSVVKYILKMSVDHRIKVRTFWNVYLTYWIQRRIKGIMDQSMIEFMIMYQKQNESLFQKSITLLIHGIFKHFQSQTQSPTPQAIGFVPLKLSTLPQQDFKLPQITPNDIPGVLSTIITLCQLILAKPDDQFQAKIKILKMLRKINHIIFSTMCIQTMLPVVRELVQVYVKVGEEWDYAENEEKRERKMMVREMAQWQEFYQQIALVLHYKSPYHLYQGNRVFDYFRLTEQWQISQILPLKEGISTILRYIYKVTFKRQHPNPHRNLQTLLKQNQLSLYHSLMNLRPSEEPLTLSALQIVDKNSQHLKLFGQILDDTVFVLKKEHLIQLCRNVLMPLLNLVIEGMREDFEEDPRDIKLEFQDCLFKKQRDTLLSRISGLLQVIIQAGESKMQNFFMKTILQSLDRHFNNNPPSLCTPQTCYFLLSLLSSQPEPFQPYLQILSNLFNPHSLNYLKEYQRCLFYSCIAVNFGNIYQKEQERKGIIMSAMREDYGVAVRIFALDFVQEVVEKVGQEFITVFLQKFMVMGQFTQKWQTLQKIVQYHLLKFNPNYTLNLLINIHKHLHTQFHHILTLKSQNQLYTTVTPHFMLFFCQKITLSSVYLHLHPQIQQFLWKMVLQLLQISANINMEDGVITVAFGLMRCREGLNGFLRDNYKKVIFGIQKTMETQEFGGTRNYGFIVKMFQKLEGNVPTDINIATQILELLLQILSYFAYFPQQIQMFNNAKSFNESVLSLLFLTLSSNSKLISVDYYKLILQCCNQSLQKRRDIKQQYPKIRFRIMLLKLMCEYRLQIPLKIQHIKFAISSRYHLGSFNQKMLLYILGEVVYDGLQRQMKIYLVDIVLAVIRWTPKNIVMKENSTESSQLDMLIAVCQCDTFLKSNSKEQAILLMHYMQNQDLEVYKNCLQSLTQRQMELINELSETLLMPKLIKRIIAPKQDFSEQEEQEKQEQPKKTNYHHLIRHEAPREAYGDESEEENRIDRLRKKKMVRFQEKQEKLERQVEGEKKVEKRIEGMRME